MSDATARGAAEGYGDLDKILDIAKSDPITKAAIDDAVAREQLRLQLVAARRRRRLSVRDVAAAMNAQVSDLRNLEEGLRDPTLGTLQRYARAIGARLVVTLTTD